MHFDIIVSKVNQEKALFESEIRTVVSQANVRRQELMGQILLNFDGEVGQTISPEDFFAGVEVLGKMHAEYQEVIHEAGFPKDVVNEWVIKRSCPAHYALKPTLQLALAAVLQDLLLNNVEDDTLQLLSSRDVSEMIQDRSELLLKNIDSFPSLENLSVRSRNALKNDYRYLLGDLLLEGNNALLRMPNFGRKSLNEVIQALTETKTGLSLGCLSPDEESEALLRRKFNVNAGEQIPSKFRIDGREEIVDESLLSALQELGMRYKTELATCPKNVIDELCAGKVGWKRQLGAILGHTPFYYHLKLELYMEAPSHIHSSVKVYKSL